MDPLRLLVRVVFGYCLLLVLVRIGGKRSVKHASAFEFTLVLILGDMVDDLVWAEVAAAQFVVAATVLMGTHMVADHLRFRAGAAR